MVTGSHRTQAHYSSDILTSHWPIMKHPDHTLTFEAQGHYVAIRYRDFGLSYHKTSSKRGQVLTFSRKSRKRILEKCARLDLRGVIKFKPIIFVTLTYAAYFPTPAIAKNHLRAFLERIRRLSPNTSGVWRLELQERGAPHFHVIFFGLPYIPKAELQAMWGDIIGIEYWDYSQAFPRAPMTRIEAISNARRAMAYISKYVAKEINPSGFNNLPYLHALVHSPEKAPKLGRVWGVFNGKCLPFAMLIVHSINVDKFASQRTLIQFKRLMAHKWSRANHSGRNRGASLFVDYVDCWYKAFLWSLTEYYI